MRKTIILAAALLTFSSWVRAQEKFTEHLQRSEAGQGKVTILQDQRLTDLVNGDAKLETSGGNASDKRADEDLPAVKSGKKVKMRGYRIQVYWGGSQRIDQTKATRAGNTVTSLFPELQAYTSFESPHWRCRVGDFTTRQDAADYLRKMREANMGKDAMIVRSEIYVIQ